MWEKCKQTVNNSQAFGTLLTDLSKAFDCLPDELLIANSNAQCLGFETQIIRDKLFKKYKKTRLHVDKEIYKRARYSVQHLIAKKKEEFFDNKLR